jgi:hypothetical protein
MALGAGAVVIAFSMNRVFSSSAIFQWGGWQDYAFIGALTLFGLALVVISYDFGFRGRRH